VKSFVDKYYCCVSFRKNLAIMKVITERLQIVRDNPKLKLKEIQKMMHVKYALKKMC
jgi:hypothetical protein